MIKMQLSTSAFHHKVPSYSSFECIISIPVGTYDLIESHLVGGRVMFKIQPFKIPTGKLRLLKFPTTVPVRRRRKFLDSPKSIISRWSKFLLFFTYFYFSFHSNNCLCHMNVENQVFLYSPHDSVCELSHIQRRNTNNLGYIKICHNENQGDSVRDIVTYAQ